MILLPLTSSQRTLLFCRSTLRAINFPSLPYYNYCTNYWLCTVEQRKGGLASMTGVISCHWDPWDGWLGKLEIWWMIVQTFSRMYRNLWDFLQNLVCDILTNWTFPPREGENAPRATIKLNRERRVRYRVLRKANEEKPIGKIVYLKPTG